MISRFLKFGQAHNFYSGNKIILLAVSGGIDSMVMTDLFVKAGIQVAIAHCNFGLRGKESEEDAEFVKRISKMHKITFHVKKFDTERYAIKNKISIQHAARELRYEWFSELVAKQNYECIATAHHLDDSIETFLINLMRGTGIQGLTGIPEKREGVIRPLLCFTRQEIKSYAGANRLEWREDSSNASPDYLRNRIRQNLVPMFLELQPQFPGIMMKNLEHLRDTAALQDEIAEVMAGKYLKKEGKDIWNINIPLLKKERNADAKLQLILSSLGIKNPDLAGMLQTDKPGKIYYSGGFRVLRDRTFLIIDKLKARDAGQIPISIKDEYIRYEETTINLNILKNDEIIKHFEDKDTHLLDAGKLKFPLQLRHWKAGDSFYPLGMKQRKKISDFLIDKKVNRFDKEKCLVILSGSDIICILGHRIDERFKLTPQTKRIYRISIK